MNRRRFTFTIAAAAITPPLAAAPPGRTVRIGVAMTEFSHFTGDAIDSVVQGLREQGYVEGRNVVIERRTALWPDGPMRANIEELIAMKPDLIVAGCGWSIQSVRRATQSIPVVMIAASDPVGRGWVASLARPGGNLTGVSGMIAEIPPKLLDHLRLVIPELRAVGIPLNLQTPFHKTILRDIAATADRLAVRIVPIDLNGLTTVAMTREAFRAAGVQAIMNVPDDNLYWLSVDRIVAAARELKLPTAVFRSDFLVDGHLMSYGARPLALFRRAARYADRIANGADPSTLPIELPTDFEFAINLKEAERLGISIPRAALLRTDTLIR